MSDPTGTRLARFDVCNGDADGLCALRQWRLHAPAPATLVTGLKHDIELLARVPAQRGDEVSVFDVSLQRNRAELLRLLEAGAHVRYFDHHAAGAVPAHPALDAHIDLASDTCTSLIVDRALDGAFRAWALVGAYGDNLTDTADRLARASGIAAADRAALKRLGEAINYNAYGDDERDVQIAPRALYEVLSRHADPLDLATREPIIDALDAGRRADLARGLGWPPHRQDARGRVYLLPDEPWTRRVLGCLANELANAEPALAHAVLKRQRDGSCAVSVRAPLAAPAGANELCRRFGGAGRARAAGIERLPAHQIDRFIADFAATRWDAPETGVRPPATR